METRFSRFHRTTRIVVAIMGATLMQHVDAATAKVDYKGQIVNELQKPIAGAKVALIGTPLSATTDFRFDRDAEYRRGTGFRGDCRGTEQGCGAARLVSMVV